ncbi:ATP-dependent DNA helicase RecG [Clostridium sp. Bc-iso-3]|nr:ATP-dependent DNA helicase RecG [Clostridium sp. Bc-iso-3]
MSIIMNSDIKEMLKKSIMNIKGVGETRARLFQKLGIFNIEDMITHFPADYEDRSSFKKICQLTEGESCTFEGIIMSKVTEKILRRGLTLYQVYIKDDSGTIIGTWYNQPYLKKVLCVGESYIFYGKIVRGFKTLEVQNPIYEKADRGEHKKTMKIVPVYPATANLSQNTIRAVMEKALEQVVGNLEDVLPLWIRKTYCLSDINYAFSNIHFPRSDEDIKNARHRLVFEELLLLQLGLLSIKTVLADGKEGIAFKPNRKAIQDFIGSIGFQLTNAQKRVWEEIEKDMESSRVMNRLVQGDVGSGKTIVAALALIKTVKSGYQGAMMVPTEILAKQHYESLRDIMDKHGVSTALLVGSQTKRQKSEILSKIESGEVNIVIGTHALIEDKVKFLKLGMVITDEQHRFGVRQRTVLSNKGLNPDVLVMTATPIPRTLALILYGDLDISIIDELPPGRKAVETYAVDNSMRERINSFIRKNVLEGRQAYIVCPLVDESDEIEAKSALKTAEKIAKEDFRDFRVGLLHGKMPSRDKEDVMQRFLGREIDILVSTTVIEVGVNVPNATMMVVENAERFGLAQLHQLRGRVGRGSHQSYCILYNEGKSKVAKERMKVMQQTTDGFIISEKDLLLRGPGEFFGTRQHGLPDLKIANLYRDMDILKKAQEAAQEILKRDKNLCLKENLKLKEKIAEKFKGKLNDVSLN